jgi:hypothetical protein
MSRQAAKFAKEKNSVKRESLSFNTKKFFASLREVIKKAGEVEYVKDRMVRKVAEKNA